MILFTVSRGIDILATKMLKKYIMECLKTVHLVLSYSQMLENMNWR